MMILRFVHTLPNIRILYLYLSLFLLFLMPQSSVIQILRRIFAVTYPFFFLLVTEAELIPAFSYRSLCVFVNEFFHSFLSFTVIISFLWYAKCSAAWQSIHTFIRAAKTRQHSTALYFMIAYFAIECKNLVNLRIFWPYGLCSFSLNAEPLLGISCETAYTTIRASESVRFSSWPWNPWSLLLFSEWALPVFASVNRSVGFCR